MENTTQAAEGGKLNLQALLTNVLEWIMTEGIKVVIAILVMVISFIIINVISKRLRNRLLKKHADKTIIKSLVSAGKILLKIIVVMALLGYLGVETAGITTVLATLGVGISLAVQGTLSNFAGGILILFTRPFKEDDFIETNDVSGTVEGIGIVYTHLKTPDNKEIVLPNGTLANSTIINYSRHETRRVDMTFDISYDSDYRQAIRIIEEIFANDEHILKDPAPFIRLTEHADSALIITARAWAKGGDYWTVKFDTTEKVLNAFNEAGIEIPYNKLDVNLSNMDNK